jgi:hypothetical protein
MSNPLARPISHVCCGTRLRRIDIDTGASMLTFTFCGRCERMEWFANGVRIDREGATGLAGLTPTRRRAAAEG